MLRATTEPMYATVGTEVPAGDGWTFEPKFDGIRVLAFVGDAPARDVRLVTRNGKDKALQFPEVVEALRALGRRARRALVLDGEVVAIDEPGTAGRFQALQSRMHAKDQAHVARVAREDPAVLVAFDLLQDGARTLTGEPWHARRARLERLVPVRDEGIVRTSESSPDAEAMLRRARRAGWEGVIAKRVNARYVPGARSRDWLKLKLQHRAELVVGGWTEPRNSRPHLGALLLGYFDEAGALHYAGHMGGGFTHTGLAEMRRLLDRRARRTPPFVDPPRTNEPAHWVRPELVVEVKFAEWTADRRLRQPIFLGLRDDKPAREVRLERESMQDWAMGIGGARDEGRGASEREATMATMSGRKSATGKRAAKKPAVRKGAAKTAVTRTAGAKRAVAKKAGAKRAVAKTAGAKTAGAKRGGAKTAGAKMAGARKGRVAKQGAGKRGAKTATKGAARGPATDGGPPPNTTIAPRATAAATPRARAASKRRPRESVLAQLERIEREGGTGEVTFDSGAAQRVTSLGKPYFPDVGVTKGEVMRYYAQVAPALLPLIDDRPLALKRYPEGIGGQSFFQQRAADDPPEGVRVAEVEVEGEGPAPRYVGGNLETLLHTVQMGAIAVHAWLSRLRSIERPDYSLIDLDPGEGVPFARVVELGRSIGNILRELGLNAAVKTSGSRGLHVGIPLHARATYAESAALAEAVASELVARHPALATLERRLDKRPRGSVYVDVQQNARGKSVVSPYAVRAKPLATVSAPLRWTELRSALSLQAFTVRSEPRRLARVGDLWGTALDEGNDARRIRTATR